jgi:hypothetical protein
VVQGNRVFFAHDTFNFIALAPGICTQWGTLGFGRRNQGLRGGPAGGGAEETEQRDPDRKSTSCDRRVR